MNIYFMSADWPMDKFSLANPDKSVWGGNDRFDQDHHMSRDIEYLLEQGGHRLFVLSNDGIVSEWLLSRFKLKKEEVIVIRYNIHDPRNPFKLLPDEIGVVYSDRSGVSVFDAVPLELPEWGRKLEEPLAKPNHRLQSWDDIRVYRIKVVELNKNAYAVAYNFSIQCPIPDTGNFDDGYWNGDYNLENYEAIYLFRKGQDSKLLRKNANENQRIRNMSIADSEGKSILVETYDQDKNVLYQEIINL